MLKQEWQNIFHNTWLKVVLAAIIAIPSIYACVFLGSMWDPYGNTEEIPVAVVNLDETVTYQQQTLNVGKELVNNLKENQAMNFQFVDKQTASRGLKDGKYYMVITIPKDFSKNATTLLDENPQKMILNYTTNPGSNYIASKMDDSAIEKIKSEISSSVTKTYAKTIFEQISKLADGLQNASTGTNELLEGTNQLADGSNVLSDNLQVLATSTLTFKDGSEDLTVGLNDYLDGVVTIKNGIYSLKDGMDTLQSSSSALPGGITALNNGSNALLQGISEYTNGVSQASNGLMQVVANNQALLTGLTNLANGSDSLVNANGKIVDGLSVLATTLQENTNESNQGLIDQVINSNDSLNQANQLLNQLLSNESSQTLAIKWLNQPLTGEEAKLLTSDQNIQMLLQNYAYNQLVATVTNGNQTTITKLNSGLKQIDQAVNSETGLLSGSKQIQAGLTQLDQNIEQTLLPGVNAYLAGTNQVSEALVTITKNNQTLVDGSMQLNDGITALANQTPALINGIDQLVDGVDQLSNGSAKLTANNQTIIDGANSLTDGASQISAGTRQLADGSLTLTSGLKTALQGIDTLDQGLNDGTKQASLTTSDATLEMMAKPVETDHQEISAVANNGHAMAPYMMSVALYVACLAFTLMYPIRNGIKEAASPFKYWLSKASIMYSVSTLSAIILITALRLICNFQCENLLLTYILAIIVAASFMSLVMLLTLTTGYIGEFLLLVFMIFNLGGSAGTYPLETSSAFFKAIHPFVPYTYSVNGFRKVISMTNVSIINEILVFVGILLVCSLLTIVYYRFKNKQDKHLIPQAFIKVNE
ncbi:MAG: YhgE/Pip family protein [Thomasclavelia sp.]